MTEPTEPEPTTRLRIAAKVPYPDGRGGTIAFSSIEFSIYDQPGAQLDIDAAAGALARFHTLIIQHYELAYRVRQQREAARQQAQSAGRPAAALVAGATEW